MQKTILTILVDNEPSPGLKNDWGWSVYIKDQKTSILFDADTDPEVLSFNIHRLKININEINYLILSHHHHDHYGGLPSITNIKKKPTIYVPPGETDYLTNYDVRPIIVHKPMKLNDEKTIIGPLYSTSADLYEISLAINLFEKEIILITGCSHPGIDKILNKALDLTGAEKAYLVIGGFHNPHPQQIDDVAAKTRYIAPAHCSGEEAKKYTRKKYPDKYIEVKTGTIIELPIEP